MKKSAGARWLALDRGARLKTEQRQPDTKPANARWRPVLSSSSPAVLRTA